MKMFFFRTVLPGLILFSQSGFSDSAFAPKSAVEYMQKVENARSQVTGDFLIYVSAVAHEKSVRKVEKKRKDLLNSISQAKTKMKHLPPFEKSDTTLNGASFTYMKILYSVLKEDYAKLLEMEETSEQSYDKMEAYLHLRDEVNHKLKNASDRMESATKAFAADHNIALSGQKNDADRKSEIVEQADNYYNQVYLILFRSMKQEASLMAALDKKDVGEAEQNRLGLLKCAEDGLGKLSELMEFENDAGLFGVCKNMLVFYQKEAIEKTPILVDYAVKSQAFAKAKSKYESGSKSKSDADAYNQAVKEINDAGDVYNRTNVELSQARARLAGDWENGAKKFMEKHIPEVK